MRQPYQDIQMCGEIPCIMIPEMRAARDVKRAVIVDYGFVKILAKMPPWRTLDRWPADGGQLSRKPYRSMRQPRNQLADLFPVENQKAPRHEHRQGDSAILSQPTRLFVTQRDQRIHSRRTHCGSETRKQRDCAKCYRCDCEDTDIERAHLKEQTAN